MLLCEDKQELAESLGERVRVEGWICQHVWKPYRARSGTIIGGRGELLNRQYAPLVVTVPNKQSPLYQALLGEGSPVKLAVGIVYSLSGVVPKHTPKSLKTQDRTIDLHLDQHSTLELVEIDMDRGLAHERDMEAQAPPLPEEESAEQALAAHDDGEVGIILCMDVVATTQQGEGWLLEDASGVQLELPAGFLDKSLGRLILRDFGSGAAAVSIRATPVRLVSKAEKKFGAIAGMMVQGGKVSKTEVVLEGVHRDSSGPSSGGEGDDGSDGEGPSGGKRRAGGRGAGVAAKRSKRA
ncbi:hypothetical protein ABPG75_003796 [Micractinium tetrahymenae]